MIKTRRKIDVERKGQDPSETGKILLLGEKRGELHARWGYARVLQMYELDSEDQLFSSHLEVQK